MAWARVDDGWWAHPKVLGLDLDARGLWVSALSWSCQQRTDMVPDQIVRMCGDDGTVAKKLVAAGLWDETDGGYLIHDWGDYQSETAKKAAAGREGGRRSGETRRKKAEQTTDEVDAGASDEAEQGASREAEASASTEAGPSRPGPSRPNQPLGARKRATQLPDGWEPNGKHREIAVEVGANVQAEAEQFADFHRAKGSTFKDWDAAFRTWLRNTRKFGGPTKPASSTRHVEVCDWCGQATSSHDDATCEEIRKIEAGRGASFGD